MNLMKLVLSVTLLSQFVMAQENLNDLAMAPQSITLSVESYVEVNPIPAEVTVENGVVTYDNCTDLSEEDPLNVKYTLKLEGKNLVCSPASKRVLKKENIELPLGFAATFEGIQNYLRERNKMYEEGEGLKNGHFSKPAPQPSCSLSNDGTFDISTCTCSQSMRYTFDPQSKICVESPEYFAVWTNSCGRSSSYLTDILETYGLNFNQLDNQQGVKLIGSCAPIIVEGLLPANDLVHQLVFVSAYYNTITELLEKSIGKEIESFKVFVTEAEEEAFKQWVAKYTKESSPIMESLKSLMDNNEDALTIKSEINYKLIQLERFQN